MGVPQRRLATAGAEAVSAKLAAVYK